MTLFLWFLYTRHFYDTTKPWNELVFFSCTFPLMMLFVRKAYVSYVHIHMHTYVNVVDLSFFSSVFYLFFFFLLLLLLILLNVFLFYDILNMFLYCTVHTKKIQDDLLDSIGHATN